MGYIMPIPHFQYRQYQERVINNTSDTTAIERVQKVSRRESFEEVLKGTENDFVEPYRKENGQQDNRKAHEAFQLQMKRFSGEGILFQRTI
ncbi:MAG TPA: hypothetical protein VEY51_11060 [Chondromyces sp.]|nr:hypothetical protein [Chondromyces sp.]